MAARRVPPEKPPTKIELANLEHQEKVWRATVGTNIRNVRTSSGLSQVQLATRANVNANYLGQVELGRRAPTTDFMARLAFVLGVSPADFLVQN